MSRATRFLTNKSGFVSNFLTKSGSHRAEKESILSTVLPDRTQMMDIFSLCQADFVIVFNCIYLYLFVNFPIIRGLLRGGTKTSLHLDIHCEPHYGRQVPSAVFAQGRVRGSEDCC